MKKKKTKTKGAFFNFKGVRIEKRLKKAFNIVTIISAVASLVGLLAIVVVVSNFKNAMSNYALPQGDIALFMKEYAECRSNTRGIIGYEDQEQIDLLVGKHTTRVENTKNRLAAIYDTLISDEGRAAYAKIEAALNAYFEKESEIIAIGATTDQELCRQAQDMAINELAPLYNDLDAATLELMNINIEKEQEMEVLCNVLQIGAIVLMVVLVLTAGIISRRIAFIISKGISSPLTELEDRFASFAEGDIRSHSHNVL